MTAPTTEPTPARPKGGRIDWDDPVRAALQLIHFLLVFAAVTLGAALAGQQVTNPDTYFHLRYGAEFWGHWSPWHPGTVTPFATRHWLPTQWLSEIVMARFEAWFGLPGVAWLTGLWVLGLVLAVFWACRRWAGGLTASFATLLAVIGSAEGLSGRPQVLSYLLIAVVVGAWVATADDGRPRWWLLAVAWVWPLLHGMWLLGLVTSFVAAVGIAIDRRAELDRRGVVRLLGLPVGMAVLSALTPIGPGLYGAVVLVGGRASYFTEWGPPDYSHDVANLVAALVVLALVVAALRQRTANSWFVVLMVALTGGWAIYSGRTVPIAAITAAILLCYVVGQRAGAEPATLRRDRLFAAGLVLVALVVLACVVPFTAAEPRPYPAWANRELAGLPQGTPVLTADYDGSVFMWTHPNIAVIAHGYGDSFTDAELHRDRAIWTLAPSWRSDLASLHVHDALLPASSGLAYALEHDAGWRISHQSTTFVYLTDR